MQMQVPNIAISLDEEEQVAVENRSKLRLIKPSNSMCIFNNANPISVAPAKTDMEKAFDWLTNEFKSRYNHYKSQRSVFGTVTLEVPVSECKPEMIVAILSANGVTLLEWKNVYSMTGIQGINEKRELISVNLTFDTPEIGVLNMPI